MRSIQAVCLVVSLAAAAGCGGKEPAPPKPKQVEAAVVAPPFPAELKAAFDADVAEAAKQAEAGAAARKQADETLRTTKNRAAAKPLYKKAYDHYQAAYTRVVAWAEQPAKTATLSPAQKDHYIKPLIDEVDRYKGQMAQANMEMTMR